VPAIAKKKLVAAGFEIRQDGDCEGSALFDPHDREQVKLALKLAGIRTRRELSPEKKAILVARLTAGREMKQEALQT